jgi:hypothetical protein
MAERDILNYTVQATNTSIGLSNTSYAPLTIDITQDFGIQRVARGLDSINLTVYYKDNNNILVDPDNQNVTIYIYDPLLNKIIETTETRVGTGQYLFSYTPSASATLGIYKAVHSATIGGSSIITEDFFKIVSTNPGSYYGKIVKGEDSVTAILSQESLQQCDPGVTPYVKIKSPTGVIISEGPAPSGIYNYIPGNNDYAGDYQIIFYTIVNGSQQIEYQFFQVITRREENIVSAEDFIKSFESKRYARQLAQLTYEEIDNILADAQADATTFIEYPISNKVISGEKCSVAIDFKGFLYLKPRFKNITKLIRCILRYHPQVAITLPISGFIVDGNTGIIKYIYSGGQIIPGSIRGIINEYSFDNWYEAIIDYEIGFVNDEAIRLKRAIRLLATDIISQGYGMYDVSSVKSGNYTEQYFDPLRSLRKNSIGGISPIRYMAYDILKYFKRAPII